MDWGLELIVVPTTDVDRAKSFYIDQAGFNLNVDHSAGEDFRVVQLTPPGSGCSIAVMKQPARAGAVQGLHLIVEDIDAASTQLAEHGVDVSDVFHFDEGGQQPGHDPQRRDYNSFISFDDPGREWVARAGGEARLVS